MNTFEVKLKSEKIEQNTGCHDFTEKYKWNTNDKNE